MRVPTFLGEGDRYKIEREIGHGGMGKVYRAYDKNARLDVAIKILLDGSNKEAQALFDKETTILAQLQHPNIIGITDRGQFRDGETLYPFFVMPFLKGKTLQELIRDELNPLTADHAVMIVAATARSLQAAHARGVIHRDIKPSNIFVLESGPVVVIDFGVVHFVENRLGTTVKGTTPYMAPELLDPRKAESPSAASDLFSLGVVCYEALTGKHPFIRPGANDQQVRGAILHDIPTPAFEVNLNLSLVLSQVVQKTMAKNPGHRYGGMKEFADKLERALRSEPLPEFDRQAIEGRLRLVREALSRGQMTSANDLMRSIEEDGFIDPAITSQRQKIDRALEGKWIREQIDSAKLYREANQQVAALEKLNEVLRRFPGNTEASEERDSLQEERYNKLLEEARSFMSRHLFADSRQAIQEARTVQPRDPQAIELLGEVTRMEATDREVDERKADLYQEAQKASREGDTGTAIRKLEHIMEMMRQFPLSSSERDPLYKSFYEELRSEQDRLDQASKEVRNLLSAGNTEGALSVCKEILGANPGNPLFEALKMEAENRERQNLLDYVNRLRSELESIANLQARIEVLQQAVEKYPSEPQLTELLRSNKAKLDLVNGLVSRARRSEAPGRYVAALDLWRAVKECHPLFDGIDDEIRRVKDLHDVEIRTERRDALIQGIAGLLRVGDYAEAIVRCEAGLREFPADNELQRHYAEAKERATLAPTLLNLVFDARRFLRDGDLDAALEILRKAADLDPNNQGVRQLLGATVIEKAKAALAASDAVSAERFFLEANDLIPGHPEMAGWEAKIAEMKRESVEAMSPRQESSSASTTLARNPGSNLDSVLNDPTREEGERHSQPQPEPPPTPVSAVSRIYSQAVLLVNRLKSPGVSLKPLYLVLLAVVVVVGLALAYVSSGGGGTGVTETPGPPPLPPLVIRTIPEGADIAINNVNIGRSPIEQKQDKADNFEITASMPGYETQRVSVQSDAVSGPVVITLPALPADLRVITPGIKNAQVFIDQTLREDVQRDDIGLVVPGIPVGVRNLRIQAPGGRSPIDATFEVVAGRPPTLVNAPPREKGNFWFLGRFGDTLRAACNCSNGSIGLGAENQPVDASGVDLPIAQGEQQVELNTGRAGQPVLLASSEGPIAIVVVNNWSGTPAPPPSPETVVILLNRAEDLIKKGEYAAAQSLLDQARQRASPAEKERINILVARLELEKRL